MADMKSIPTHAEYRWLELVLANHGNFCPPLPPPDEHWSCIQKQWISSSGGNRHRFNPSGGHAMERYRIAYQTPVSPT